ncbi:MAG: glycosyltransferase family 4 protein [Longimicrobiales bacterium]
MKVLFLAEGDPETSDSWSGIPRSVISVLRELGHNVSTADVDLYGIRRLVAAGCSFSADRARWRARYRLGGVGFRLRSRLATRAVERPNEYDLVLQPGATFYPRSERAPVAIYCDSNIRLAEHHYNTGKTYANRLSEAERASVLERERYAYTNAAVIFTMSERLRQSFIQDFGVPSERVHTVYGGPNFSVDEVVPSELNERSGHVVLYVGRDFDRKGGRFLLDAFRRVRERFTDAELIVVGPDRPQHVPPGVTWLGFLDRRVPDHLEMLVSAYRRATLFCLPTLFEPFGVSYLEAMVYGLPCIGTDVMAVPEIIQPDRTGHIVPPGDVDALAYRMEQLFADPMGAYGMGMAGRARALSTFTWEATVDRMMNGIKRTFPEARWH